MILESSLHEVGGQEVVMCTWNDKTPDLVENLASRGLALVLDLIIAQLDTQASSNPSHSTPGYAG